MHQLPHLFGGPRQGVRDHLRLLVPQPRVPRSPHGVRHEDAAARPEHEGRAQQGIPGRVQIAKYRIEEEGIGRAQVVGQVNYVAAPRAHTCAAGEDKSWVRLIDD